MKKLFALISAVVLVTAPASAAVITEGFTFSVADAFVGPSGVGTHFHSSTGGDFGNPAGKAEVGELGDEEVRGLSEYDLAGLAGGGPAFVTFRVDILGGLFGQWAFDGVIEVLAYLGNNTENLSDFEAASTGLVGSFSTAGLVVGQTLSFDISALLTAAITAGDPSLGIRLQKVGSTGGGAIVFDSFRLTTENLSDGVIPLPAAAWLFLAGIGALAARRKLVRA